jgi:DDE superfamily endonuclease
MRPPWWRRAGEVWFGEETTLREFSPLRAVWARCGQQQIVVIAGRNARRVVHGALNAATGELVAPIRERSWRDDCAAFVEAMGHVRPAVLKLLIWDNAAPHHPTRVQAVAAAARANLRKVEQASCGAHCAYPSALAVCLSKLSALCCRACLRRD